jgi:activator of HSP90 ATPase
MGQERNLEGIVSGLTRRRAITGVAMAFSELALDATGARADVGEEISRTEESIHQSVALSASRKRVYEALTDTRQFDKVIEISGAKKSMALGSEPTRISGEVGGAFTIFGGHIIGRQIELRPNERIVQVWRVVDWKPGVYSIARFELEEQGSGTRIVFEHTGFPKGLGEHLAEGWRGHYWEPLKQFLG